MNNVSTDGVVSEVTSDSNSALFHYGADFKLETLPVDNSRILYPPQTASSIYDPTFTISESLHNPLGSEPLAELLNPDMKLTIAFDDVLFNQRPISKPDIRQQIIEQILDIAAVAGVDDVHLIVARGLNRQLNEVEQRLIIGNRVYDTFASRGLIYNHDAEDASQMTILGQSEAGKNLSLNKRAAESDLLIYIGINLGPVTEVNKSTTLGLSDYETEKALQGNHGVNTNFISDAGLKIFRIEANVKNSFSYAGPLAVLEKRELDWSSKDRTSVLALEASFKYLPEKAKLKLFNSSYSAYETTAIFAGSITEVAEASSKVYSQQHLLNVVGQTDVVTMGISHLNRYNVNSFMNPLLVMFLGLGQYLKNSPVVRKGGVAILSHPLEADFHPVHHASHIDFFDQVLTETTDPNEIANRYEKQYSQDDWYKHLYSTSFAYHGSHPIFMWSQIAEMLNYLSQVIVIGGNESTATRLGIKVAANLPEALEMAEGLVGKAPSISHLHNPNILLSNVVGG